MPNVRFHRRASRRKSRASRPKSAPAQVSKNTKAIKSLMQSRELKFQDAEIALTAIVANLSQAGAEMDPANDYFPAPAQGLTNQNRLGKEIVVTGFTLDGTVHRGQNTTASLITNVVVLVLQDTRTNGVQFDSEEVLESVSNAENIPSAHRALEFRKKFRILAIRRIQIEPQVFGITASQVSTKATKRFTIKKRLNMKMRWSDDANTLSTLETNSLHVMAVADQTGCTLAYRVRTTFRG